MKKISKANIKKFNYEVKNIIRNYDPKYNIFIGRKDFVCEWILDTPYGRLFINPDNDCHFVYSIFCKFEEPEKVILPNIEHFNPVSGKWNFHSKSLPEILNWFRIELHEIMRIK